MCGRRRREPCVAGGHTGRRAPQERVERRAPPGRQRLDLHCALKLVPRVRRRIEKRVDLRDGHAIVRLAHLDDAVAGAHVPFPKHAQVEARPAARRQQRRHPRFVHADADAIASYPRLRDLEQRGADLVPVTDANHIVGQPSDREILAELSVNEISPPKLLLPMTIGFDLIHEHGALLASVPGQIALPVAVQIQTADTAAAGDGIFPDPRSHRAAIPLDVTRQADVDGQQLRWRSHSARRRRIAVLRRRRRSRR